MGKLVFSSLITLGLISSFVCGIILAALVYLQSMDIWFAISLTILINVILWLIGPWITDHINSWFYKVTFLPEAEVERLYPHLHELIKKVSLNHKFPYPKIGIIPDRNPTAFTYGTARYNSRIVFTEGIIEFLTPEESGAVIAHELGHIVNRDFMVMMIASTIVQILYEIYAVLIRVKGKKSGYAKLIALSSYFLYIISTYLLYYLSRTREYLADEFSASMYAPQHLANALIKIAYGIVSAQDSDSSKRLLESTRQLGIIDVKNARHVGLTSYVTHNDPNLIAEVMVYDKVNPWAKIIELSSTHPLTGKRISHLAEISKKLGHPFAYDIRSAEQRLLVDHNRLITEFILGIGIYTAPIVLTILSLLLFSPGISILTFAGALIIQIVYKFPQSNASDTTILDEMRNPYASPLRGKPVRLSGNVIGRGTAGYIFSEDMMYQDRTGLTFLDYNSLFGWLGNIFFACGKIKTLFGVTSLAEGWFFRDMSSRISLKYIKTPSDTIRSHPILWSLLGPILLIILSGILLSV